MSQEFGVRRSMEIDSCMQYSSMTVIVGLMIGDQPCAQKKVIAP